MDLPLEPTATLFQSKTTQLIYLTSILILSEGSPYILFRSNCRTKLFNAFLMQLTHAVCSDILILRIYNRRIVKGVKFILLNTIFTSLLLLLPYSFMGSFTTLSLIQTTYLHMIFNDLKLFSTKPSESPTLHRGSDEGHETLQSVQPMTLKRYYKRVYLEYQSRELLPHQSLRLIRTTLSSTLWSLTLRL